MNFKSIETSLNLNEIKGIIENTAKELGWQIIELSDNYAFARTFPNPLSGSWGEQVTILIENNQVCINSICDLEEQTSVVSMGRNRKNEQTFLKKITQVEKFR